MSERISPWKDKSSYAYEWVLKSDVEAVEKFQAKQESDARFHLRTDVIPEPWCGPIKSARVLLLASNPHWDDRDDGMPKIAHDLMYENLSGELPLFWLDPRVRGLTGGDWYRKKALKPVLEIVPEDVVARGVSLVDLVGYRSHQWNSNLAPPSMSFTIDMVKAAINRDAVIIVLRSKDEWLRHVPELGRYRHVYRNSSWQQVQLSEKNTRWNLEADKEVPGFEKIIEVLRKS